MGRQKLHFTQEELAAAKRARSVRYYEKHKIEINKNRRLNYKALREQIEETKRREKPANPADSMPFEVPFSEYNHDSLAIWIDYAKRLNHRLIEITDGSPAEFVDGLCRQFMSDLDVEPLKALSKKCNDILNAINLCQKKVRQLAGVGSQLDSIVETSHSLQKIIGWIEEIKGVIIIDESCVFNIYADNQFTFQEVLPTYINS